MINYRKNHKVSILIPCYNSEAFISETLNCCLNQTYQNIEVVLVDDGSKDKSLEIASKFEDKRIKVISQSNSGACRARNLAFKNCTGDYIMYLDADDLISNTYVELLVNALEGKSINTIATGQWDRFHKDIKEATFPLLNIYKNYDQAFNLLIDMWTFGEMLACTSYLIPRGIVEKINGWDETVLKNQDGEFFCRILIAGGNIVHVPNAKFYYRTGEYLTVSKANSKKKIASMLDTFINYRKNALVHENSKRVREALSINFTLFIYLHGNQYPDLYKRAKEEVNNLGVGYVLKNEPYRVKRICKIIGFENFMTIRKILLKR